VEKSTYSRRKILGGLTLGALALSCGRKLNSPPAARKLTVYVGTYTTGSSEGIYTCALDLTSGELSLVGTTKGVVNPSFLAIDQQGQRLYAVNETDEFQGEKSGAVSAFNIDPKTGGLTFLNQRPSAGASPCHLAIDSSRKFLFVANYNGGNVSVFALDVAGLGKATATVQHHGKSINPERQEGPHAHGVVLDQSNRFLFVTDLGLDKVMVYRFDAARGGLTANEVPAADLKPGAGPRHFAFHPNGRWAYVINELDSTFTAFDYDRQAGKLSATQTVSTLPAGFAEPNTCAELVVSQSGRFLYGSNRGHDSIAVFAIDQRSGQLALVEHVATGGKTPRNFAIDPTGTFLLAANQNSNNIVTFRVEKDTGKLTATGHVMQIPTPVCVVSGTVV